MALRPWSRFLRVAVLGGVALVELSDPVLDEFYRPWLAGLARDLPGYQFHLDFDDVESLSDVGLRTLLSFHKEATARGGQVRLLNLVPALHEILSATSLRGALDTRSRQAD